MHCNLRPPDATPALFCFNYDAHAKFEVAVNLCMPYYGVFAADTLLYAVILTSDPVTFPFDLDLKHLQCDVMNLFTIFERNRAIRGGVIAISVYLT